MARATPHAIAIQMSMLTSPATTGGDYSADAVRRESSIDCGDGLRQIDSPSQAGNRFANTVPTHSFSSLASIYCKSLICLVSALGLEPRTP